MKMNIWILLQKYRIEVLGLDRMAVSIKEGQYVDGKKHGNGAFFLADKLLASLCYYTIQAYGAREV